MYYKKMYNMFGSVELALAAYNAGPGNVKKYHAVPPYGETKRFVSKIMTDVNKQKHNPDPAVLKAGRSYQAAGKPMPKVLSQSLAKVPAAKLQDTSDLHAEILDEKQIELHLETRPVAI